jgi:hypothetical protein
MDAAEEIHFTEQVSGDLVHYQLVYTVMGNHWLYNLVWDTIKHTSYQRTVMVLRDYTRNSGWLRVR